MKATLTGLRGLMLDLDGTVYEDNRLIPGAAEAIAALRERGFRMRFVTNTTNKRRETIRDKLHVLGIESDASEIFTAPVAASLMLRRHPEARCWVVTRGDSIQEFQGLRLDEDRPDFVVLGDLMEGFTFELLNRVFRKLMDGAELIAMQKNRYWMTQGKLTLDMGPFVAALEFATGRRARVVGKPSREFFHLALAHLDLAPHQAAMVGDDWESDIAGAQGVGLRTILVRTGKYQPGDEKNLDPRPDGVIEGLGQLPEILP